MPCPECGASGVGSSDACEVRFQALGLRRFEDPSLAADWRLIVDCYSVQHAKYILSGRSLAAHLTGVCIAVEYGGDESLLRAVQRWLSRTRELAKPAVPSRRGDVTIEALIDAAPDERHDAVFGWARAAWAAWTEHQSLARKWITEARGG